MLKLDGIAIRTHWRRSNRSNFRIPERRPILKIARMPNRDLIAELYSRAISEEFSRGAHNACRHVTDIDDCIRPHL